MLTATAPATTPMTPNTAAATLSRALAAAEKALAKTDNAGAAAALAAKAAENGECEGSSMPTSMMDAASTTALPPPSAAPATAASGASGASVLAAAIEAGHDIPTEMLKVLGVDAALSHLDADDGEAGPANAKMAFDTFLAAASASDGGGNTDGEQQQQYQQHLGHPVAKHRSGGEGGNPFNAHNGSGGVGGGSDGHGAGASAGAGAYGSCAAGEQLKSAEMPVSKLGSWEHVDHPAEIGRIESESPITPLQPRPRVVSDPFDDW